MYEATVTIYTYPTAVTIEEMVRKAARRDSISGRVTIVRYRPRSTDSSIRQMIDVDIKVEGEDPFAGLDVPFTDQ